MLNYYSEYVVWLGIVEYYRVEVVAILFFDFSEVEGVSYYWNGEGWFCVGEGEVEVEELVDWVAKDYPENDC